MKDRIREWLREPNSIPRSVRILVVAVVAVVTVGGGAFAVEHTYQPSYCANCHGASHFDYTAPSLIHPTSVHCFECHLPPGVPKFFPIRREKGLNVFTADPRVVSRNCIRCHSNIPKTNSTAGFKYNRYHINIPHRLMLAQRADCVTCHYNIRHDFSPHPTNRPPMQTCFRSGCHELNTPLGNCTLCHVNGPPAGKTMPNIQELPPPVLN